jgi:hypothetical protein
MREADASLSLVVVWRLFAACLLSGFVWVVFAAGADAQGVVVASETFRCGVNGQAIGSMFGLVTSCPTSINPDLSNIFSFFVCNAERISASIFGNVYCSTIADLKPVMAVVLTLAVTFFGVGFSIGVIQFTARELTMLLLKLALLWVFTTEAAFMIGVAFKFFVTGAQTGIAIAVESMFKPPPGTPPVCASSAMVGGQSIYCFLDNFLKNAINNLTAGVGMAVENGENPCKNAIFAALAILAIAFPPMFYMAFMILAKIGIVFIRAVYGYMFSLVGLAFLMMLSPIYLSLGLFRQTRSWFDKYLGYLVSFTLQMLLVFTFLAFIFSINFRSIGTSSMDVIVYQSTTYESGNWRWPWEYCSICDFDVFAVDSNGQATGSPLPLDAPVDIAKTKLVCKPDKRALDPAAMLAPDDPQSTSQFQSKLLSFTVLGLLSLLILALIIDQLLTLIPLLAQTLAGGMGASYAPMLGGQAGNAPRVALDMPFERPLQGAASGFSEGFARSAGAGESGDTLSRMMRGIQTGGERFLAGGVNSQGRRDEGMIDGMLNFLVDPQRGAAREE